MKRHNARILTVLALYNMDFNNYNDDFNFNILIQEKIDKETITKMFNVTFNFSVFCFCK